MEHTFFSSREQFAAFRNAFRKLANARAITPADIMLYNIARGLPSSRGFSPITNEVRINNGADPAGSLKSTASGLKWSAKRNPDSLTTRYEQALTAEDIARMIEAM